MYRTLEHITGFILSYKSQHWKDEVKPEPVTICALASSASALAGALWPQLWANLVDTSTYPTTCDCESESKSVNKLATVLRTSEKVDRTFCRLKSVCQS